MATILKNRSALLDADPAFLADVLTGLATHPRSIPARWLYDHRGSQLFEDITGLPEYYPTRTERHILAEHAGDIARIVGAGRVVVEFGSGSSLKTPILLEAIAPGAYVPIDISGAFLQESAGALAALFPDLPVYPVEGDFTRQITLPRETAKIRPLGFFPGSTIGNFEPAAAVDLLREMAVGLGDGALLLLGVDRVKDPETLVPAYDDAAGVTAAFNLNLLHRIRRELDSDLPVEAFRHEARWNDGESRIEMHLRAERDLSFHVAGRSFLMQQGETIHTENSRKYASRDARLLLRAGGWRTIAEWRDPLDRFMLMLAEASPVTVSP